MNTLAYVPPRIELLKIGRINHCGYGGSSAICSEIDGVPVASLLAEHGSPLFVFSENTLRRTIRRAKTAFGLRYPNTQFAWSYKTNYLKAICALFHSEGAWAEVVSEFEYEKARALGIPGEQIIFNGPHKPGEALLRALKDGARLQVDNIEELSLIEEIVGRENIGRPAISLRVYLDAGIRPIWSKFGFNLEDEEAWRIAQRIRHRGLITLDGLHTHLGTFILDARAYQRAAEKLMKFSRRLSLELGIGISTLNLGGGFASLNVLRGEYLPSEIPSFEDYADAISAGILDHVEAAEKPPRLLLETGRALVDEAGYLLTTMVAHKRNRSFPNLPVTPSAKDVAGKSQGNIGAPAILVDAGVHLLYTANWYRQKITPAAQRGGQPIPTTIYGSLCMNIDVIQDACPLPPLSPGDALVIHPVGAYNLTQSMQFIGYRPKVMLIRQDGGIDVIREREDLAYVEALDRLPDHLRMLP